MTTKLEIRSVQGAWEASRGQRGAGLGKNKDVWLYETPDTGRGAQDKLYCEVERWNGNAAEPTNRDGSVMHHTSMGANCGLDISL